MAIYYAADWGSASAAGTAADPVISGADLLSAGFTHGDECRFMRGSVFAAGQWSFASLNGIRLVDYGEKTNPRPVLLTTADTQTMLLTTCDHVYVRGLRFRATNANAESLYKDDGKAGLIEDCSFSAGNIGCRIDAHATDTDLYGPCIVRDCYADSLEGQLGAGFGAAWDGLIEFRRCHAVGDWANNTSWHDGAFGVYQGGPCLISECTVSPTAGDEVVAGVVVDASAGGSGVVVDRCYLEARYGIMDRKAAGTTEVYNSILASPGGTDFETGVHFVSGPDTAYLAHNLFLLRGTPNTTEHQRGVFLPASGAPGVSLANNVFHHADPADDGQILFVRDSTANYPSLTAHGNRYFLGSNITTPFYDGTTYDAFAAWKTSVDGDSLATESTANTLRTAIADINVNNYKWAAAMTNTDAVANSATEIPPTAPSATNLVRANWGGPNAHLLRKDINGRPRTGTLVEQGPFVDRGDP